MGTHELDDYREALTLAEERRTGRVQTGLHKPAMYVDTRKPPMWFRAVTFAGQLVVIAALAATGTTIGILITWGIAKIIETI